ncbi:MAG: hypothetical protein GY801_20015 [bacterium]|nr:hypothetical protein [bacterium]
MASIDKQYLYSIGRVRELEKGLLGEANLGRILEADEPLAVLRSIAFFRTAEDHEHPEHLDGAFRLERAYNRRLLKELVVDSPLEEVFLLPYDVDNIKLFLQGKLTGNNDVKAIEVEEGLFSKSEVLDAVFNAVPGRIPPKILAAMDTAAEQFAAQAQFALVDALLDRSLRSVQLDIARRGKNGFLIDYLQRLSDVQNISLVIRRKHHRLGREDLGELLYEGGTLAPSFFERVYDGGWESLAAAFKSTDYSQLLTQALSDANQEGFLPMLDAACDGFLIERLRRTKYLNVGIAPLLAFYLAREHELKLVRMLLAGKIFHVPQEQLRLRMREIYG